MTPNNLTEWRDLLAFGLSTAESLDIGLWSITCSDEGRRLSLHLAGDDPEEARQFAAALGVPADDFVEHYSDKTYSVGSRGPAPFYYKESEPYPYVGASVPLGERLVEISVACGLPPLTDTAEDDGAS